MGYLDLLRQLPNLRILVLGQIPADFSDWLDFVAIGILLSFVWQVDPIVFAWLGAAIGIPYIVLGPLAGTLCDQWPLRRVLVACNALRALATFALFFVPDVTSLLAVAFLRSCVDSFFGPAKQIAITIIVPEGHRMSANGLSHAVNQASKVLGPSVGAALLLIMDGRVLFLVNGCVSIVAAFILLRLKPPINRIVSDDTRAPKGLFSQMLEGMSEIRTNPAILSSLFLMAVGYFTIFIYDRFIPVLVQDLGFTENVFSLAIVAVGTGGVIGALGIGLVNLERRGIQSIVIGSLACGLMLSVLGGQTTFDVKLSAGVFVGVFAMLGVLTSAIIIPFRSILQIAAGSSHIGRVFAINEALNVAAMLGAPFVGALIAKAYGTGAPFLAGAVGMVSLVVLTAFAPLVPTKE